MTKNLASEYRKVEQNGMLIAFPPACSILKVLVTSNWAFNCVIEPRYLEESIIINLSKYTQKENIITEKGIIIIFS